MGKILIVSTVSRQFHLFEKGNIEVLHSLGYEVHAAANFSDANGRLDELDVVRHPFDIERSPFSIRNIAAYRQLKAIMKSEPFELVHCHSPMGGVLARIAARSVGLSPVIYTAHGFHFFKGAPIINWLMYYPVERILAGQTSLLLTINREDFLRAQDFGSGRVAYVPGIGIDTGRYLSLRIDRGRKREELQLPQDAIVLLSAGELNRNKNHETILRALARIRNTNIHYAVCGQGKLDGRLRRLAKALGLESQVHLLGYRDDLPEIYQAADIFVLPSYREGLSASLMEAMASGLPAICSDIRGNRDLIRHGSGGYLIRPDDAKGFAACILRLASDPELRISMGGRNREEAKKYDREIVKLEMTAHYATCAAASKSHGTKAAAAQAYRTAEY